MERPRKKRKVEIIPENEKDVFTKSKCDCNFCINTYKEVVNWDNQNFETKLQKNMKNIIQRIEQKYC